jgi:ubiquinone/menaquinone biosynthesis C-methylase UbiE
VGVDCSAAMLGVANNKTAIKGRLTRADCLRLPFRASVFDFTIWSFALGHVWDLHAMASELARVMKPKGDVFVSDLHPEAYAQGWRTGFRDARSAVHIETRPHTAEDLIRTFHATGFECISNVPLCLGKPEQPIFARAGKSAFFEEACQLTAVLVCHFRRLSSMA